MRISEVYVSIFDLPDDSPLFVLEGSADHWIRRRRAGGRAERHVMHVKTDQGLEGVCTVGDVRYTTIKPRQLDQLRSLVVGEDALDRVGLWNKLEFATRIMYTSPGWQGAFDNCLWDIAGKASGLPVFRLLQAKRPSAQAYYNFKSDDSLEEAIRDAERALESGFQSLKDHFGFSVEKNIQFFEAVRATFDSSIELMHDAAVAQYSFDDAVQVGRILSDLRYRWFEEPLPDQNQPELIQLCRDVDLPILAGETIMHDSRLLRSWLHTGALNLVRGNARHGTTPLLEIANEAAKKNTTVELNGPGGLFGLVHAHLACAIENTGPYEFFPGGSRDQAGHEMGLENPPMPEQGQIKPPDLPGWGAVWDQPYFEKHRLAVI